jgi:hypothetical protein
MDHDTPPPHGCSHSHIDQHGSLAVPLAPQAGLGTYVLQRSTITGGEELAGVGGDLWELERLAGLEVLVQMNFFLWDLCHRVKKTRGY